MISSNIFNYLLIVIGCTVSIYAQAGEKQNLGILIFGIVILMYGIFKITRKIPSKFDKDNENEDNQNPI